MNTKKLSILLLLAFFTFFHNSGLSAQSKVFPHRSGILDVTKHFGAKGDGVTDDSDAIQRAIDQVKGKNLTLYFPDGIYLVSKTLSVGGIPHSPDRTITFQGESQTGTIIKLRDNAPGFDLVGEPKVVLSLYDGQSTGDAMYNYVYDMTIDVGSGNKAAIGLRYMTNNTGAVVNVTIRSTDSQKRGYIGLDLRQHQNGPGLIKHVTIDGFDYGVYTGGNFHISLEHIHLSDQHVTGFLNYNARTAIRGLNSKNSVPALINNGWGELHLIEGNFTGGTATNTAIENNNFIYVRDIDQQGYGHALKKKDGTFIDGSMIDEWHEGAEYSLFGCEAKSLRMEIKETPEVPWDNDTTQWYIVDLSQKDDTEAVQAAFDQAASQGKTTVCFPRTLNNQNVTLSGPIRIHGSVRRVLCMNNDFRIDEPLFSSPDAVIFTLENLLYDTISFERIRNITKMGGGRPTQKCFTFENKNHVTVVVKHARVGTNVIKPAYGGNWFFDDGAGRPITISSGEKAWFRQWNPEMNLITVDGGEAWIFGMKTEGKATHVNVRNNGTAEVLGGVAYQSWIKVESSMPLFEIDNSDFFATYSLYSSGNPFDTIVKETKNGVTKVLMRNQLIKYDLPAYRSCGKSTLSQPDEVQNLNWLIFPNPAGDHLFVYPKGHGTRAEKIRIFTTSGELLREFAIHDHGGGMDIGGFPPGVCLVEITTLERTIYEKLILMRH